LNKFDVSLKENDEENLVQILLDIEKNL